MLLLIRFLFLPELISIDYALVEFLFVRMEEEIYLLRELVHVAILSSVSQVRDRTREDREWLPRGQREGTTLGPSIPPQNCSKRRMEMEATDLKKIRGKRKKWNSTRGLVIRLST